MVHDMQKVKLIKHLLQSKPLKSVIVFCSKKSEVKEIEKELQGLSLKVQSMHSDLEQTERENVMSNFRNRTTNVLVATDIVSRGIDIDGIELVINYNLPSDAEDYIHRIGRTSRGSNSGGVAFTFVNPKELGNFHKIESLIEREIKKIKLPDSLGEGPAYITMEDYKKMPRTGPSRNFKGGGKGRPPRNNKR